MKPTDNATLYFDGSFVPRYNLSGYGIVIELSDGYKFENFGDINYSTKTHNVAEYYALIRGLERSIDMKIKNLVVKGDSELIINQMNKSYECKKKHLIPLYKKSNKLCKLFDSVFFQHIPREMNVEADKLSKKAVSSQVWLEEWEDY